MGYEWQALFKRAQCFTSIIAYVRIQFVQNVNFALPQDNSTFVEWYSDFSSDATQAVIQVQSSTSFRYSRVKICSKKAKKYRAFNAWGVRIVQRDMSLELLKSAKQSIMVVANY